MTVLGPVDPDALGAVLMHEHLATDLEAAVEGPTPHERVQTLRTHCVPFLRQLGDYGCYTLVDCTTMPHRAQPSVYTMLSRRSGCHIIQSTGAYREAAPEETYTMGAHRPHRWLDMRVVDGSIEQIADLFTAEFEEGISGSRVRPGVIKLASTKPILTVGEEKALRAGAIAQRRTGLCITTHALALGTAEAQLALLEAAGADPRRVILGHVSRQIVETPEAIRRCLDRGATILPTNLRMDLEFSFDQRLVDGIRQLFNEGYGDRLVLGLDWSFKLVPFSFMPPPPYVYMFTHALPRMRELGLEEDAIERMLVHNPARLLPVQPV